jgi:hypothetical protein
MAEPIDVVSADALALHWKIVRNTEVDSIVFYRVRTAGQKMGEIPKVALDAVCAAIEVILKSAK